MLSSCPPTMDLLDVLRPEYQHGGWQPQQPINLLPALRLKYPGWIRDEILCMELVFGAERARVWQLGYRELTERGVRSQLLDLAPITQEDEDNYGFEDHCGDEYPGVVLGHLLNVRRCKQLAYAMPLFSQQAMRLIEDLALAKNEDEEDGMEAAASQSQGQLRFCWYVARGLADRVSKSLLDQCVAQVARDLKKLGLWRETAEVVQDESNILRHMAIDDLEMRARRALKALSNDERRALWLRFEASAELDSFGEVQGGQDGEQQQQFDPLTDCSDRMSESQQAIVDRVVAALYEVNLAPEE